MVRRVLAITTLATLVACGARPSASVQPASHTEPLTQRVNRDIRGISIVPKAASACPGEHIGVTYMARLADGSSVRLASNEISLLVLTGVGAYPESDGGWRASHDPMESIRSGFHLTATVKGKDDIRADTVVVPTYECSRTQLSLPVSGRFNTTTAHIRLGTYATPFYDSVVVVGVEMPENATIFTVLGPKQIRAGAIQVVATGHAGRDGRSGRPGASGGSCSNGDRGDDGEDGEAGEAGGQVDLIVESESPWLESMVSIINTGGMGGRGGSGGRGGAAGSVVGTGTGQRCTARQGQSGRQGRPGPNGSPGPSPKTSYVIASLLWRGSPLWADPSARRAFEALDEFNATRR